MISPPRRLMITCFCLLLSMASVNRADETPSTSNTSPNTADLNTQSQAREAVLNSAAWKKAEQAFNDWLSVQTIYSKPQVEYLKFQLRDNTSKMSASELKAFLDQMQLKLNILLSSDVTEARSWVGSRMSVLASHKREEIQKQLPDVVNMTAAQLEQYLYDFQQKRQTSQQAEQAASQFRQQQNQQIQQSVQMQQASIQQARERGQKAVSSQATRQVQQGYKDSMENARFNSWDPNRYREWVVPAAAYFDGRLPLVNFSWKVCIPGGVIACRRHKIKTKTARVGGLAVVKPDSPQSSQRGKPDRHGCYRNG